MSIFCLHQIVDDKYLKIFLITANGVNSMNDDLEWALSVANNPIIG